MNKCNYCGGYLGINVYYSVKVRNKILLKTYEFKYCKESCMEKDVKAQNLAKTKG
jgi:hypothetical protein